MRIDHVETARCVGERGMVLQEALRRVHQPAALAGVEIKAPVVPVVANVRAEAVSDPALIRQLLVEQVTGSVRWRESVEWMVAQGVTEFWEIGAGKALSGMIKRIVGGDVVLKAVGTPEDVAALKA